MKAHIIYAHPNPKSFNAGILAAVKEELEAKKVPHTVSDLYAMKFNPVLSAEDFVEMSQGRYRPDVAAEQQKVRDADLIFFQYPIWWAAPPAMMKGYIDRVFSMKFATGPFSPCPPWKAEVKWGQKANYNGVNSGGMYMDYYRYHGLGNDYLVMDPAQTAWELTPERIRLICDRHFGVGSDGILYGPVLDEAGEMSLRIFNPDGSEAEKSGNGVRIFYRYLVDQGYRPVGQAFPIQTKGGTVRSTVHDPRRRIQVEMGRATFRSDEIPVNLDGQPREVVNEPLRAGGTELKVTCVSVGNPHCVVPVPAVSPDRALSMGPDIEKHPFFPRRTNVQFLQVLDRNNIRIEIWERGAGYTLASGSSSCAAAAAAHKLGLVDRNVTVHMPGGTLAITIGPDYQMEMTGPVEAIAAGNFAPDFVSVLEQTPSGK